MGRAREKLTRPEWLRAPMRGTPLLTPGVFRYTPAVTELTVEAGICGFRTTIRASSTDGQTVVLDCETTCPHAAKARDALKSVDACQELFKKPCQTTVYAALSPHLPHAACPLYSGFLKAIEATAGLALPKDVSMKFAPG